MIFYIVRGFNNNEALQTIDSKARSPHNQLSISVYMIKETN